QDPTQALSKTFAEDHQELVLVRDIPIYSTCEHHLVPFYGVAHIGYIPGSDGRVTGLSKLARLADGFAKRPQVQERLTRQIADALTEVLEAQSVIVVIECEHLCMGMRGVQKPGSVTTTSAVRGGFKNNSASRAEVLSLIRSSSFGLGAHPGTFTNPKKATFMQVLDICPDAAAKRTLVMGIVNVTEDSFSDGGKWINIDKDIEHGRELVAQAADMIDVGGESTRRGATRVESEVDEQRVTPVVQALAQEGIMVSVDTMRASTAEAAVEAGAVLLNDVSGGLADTNMYSVMAQSQVPVCLMHWRTVRFGDAAGSADHNGDVVQDVHDTLARLTDNALQAGVAPELITLDPGLGFAKTPQDNWALL